LAFRARFASQLTGEIEAIRALNVCPFLSTEVVGRDGRAAGKNDTLCHTAGLSGTQCITPASERVPLLAETLRSFDEP
jgi:hypothetical protein